MYDPALRKAVRALDEKAERAAADDVVVALRAYQKYGTLFPFKSRVGEQLRVLLWAERRHRAADETPVPNVATLPDQFALRHDVPRRHSPPGASVPS